MSTDLSPKMPQTAQAFALDLAQNINGDDDPHPVAFVVAVRVRIALKDREGPYGSEFFWGTCREHNIRGQRLAKVYSSLAKNKLSDCMTIIFALGIHTLPIGEINNLLDGREAKLILPTIISLMKWCTPEFAFLRTDIEPRDTEVGFRIQAAIESYNMTRNPGRGELKIETTKPAAVLQ